METLNCLGRFVSLQQEGWLKRNACSSPQFVEVVTPDGILADELRSPETGWVS
jgi:hypothetical protein